MMRSSGSISLIPSSLLSFDDDIKDDDIKAHADWVTDARNGEGVRKLVDRLLSDDLAVLEPKLRQKPPAPATHL